MLDHARILFDRGGFFRRRLRILAERLEQLGTRKVPRDGGWYWDLKPGARPGESVVL